MTEIAEGAMATVGAPSEPAKMESDFTPRKVKIAAGILIGQTFGTSILPYSALTLLLFPLTMEFGWDAQQFSWSVPFLFACGGLSVWIIGRTSDKVGVRPVLLVGTTAVGLITLAMSFQTASLWQFYILYALLGIFGSSGLAYSKIVASTFTQHRGKAMAFLTAESNFARAGIMLVVNWLLLVYGWRDMYVVFAVTILACVPVLFVTLEEPGEREQSGRRATLCSVVLLGYGTILAFCLLSFVNKTEVLGSACYYIGSMAPGSCVPRWIYYLVWFLAVGLLLAGAMMLVRTKLGRKTETTFQDVTSQPVLAPTGPSVKIQLEGMTVREAVRSTSFWLMLLAVFIGLFVFNGLLPHLIPALVRKGFDQTTVVEIQSATLVVSVVGALVGGWMTDRFQTAKIAVPFSLLTALGSVFILVVTPTFGGATLLAVSFAFSAFSFNAMFPMGMYFPTRFFGLASFAEIVGVMFTFTNLFAGLSAPLFGFIFDRMHSYDLVFEIVIVLQLIAALCWYLMPPYRYAKNIGQMPVTVTEATAEEQVLVAGA